MLMQVRGQNAKEQPGGQQLNSLQLVVVFAAAALHANGTGPTLASECSSLACRPRCQSVRPPARSADRQLDQDDVQSASQLFRSTNRANNSIRLARRPRSGPDIGQVSAPPKTSRRRRRDNRSGPSKSLSAQGGRRSRSKTTTTTCLLNFAQRPA